MKEVYSAKELALIIDVSLARVGQLAKEGVITKAPDGKYPNAAITQYIKYLRKRESRLDDDGEKLDREYLREKIEKTKSENIKLKRELALQAMTLIKAENLDKVLLTFLKHFEAQTDWIRQNRTGDKDLLKAHLAMVQGAGKECHALKICEGEGIDAI
jgi:phage terminase Nu1 subunit (DNA packaging protein)